MRTGTCCFLCASFAQLPDGCASRSRHLIQLLTESSKPWVWVFVETLDVKSFKVWPILTRFRFTHKILKIQLLNQMNYCTIDRISIPCARSLKPGKNVGIDLNFIFIFSDSFPLKLPDVLIRTKTSFEGFIKAGRAFNLCTPPKSAASYISQEESGRLVR